MISRNIKPYLLKFAEMYPVVLVTGPRQSGKTTLIKNTFSDHEYFNLEDVRIRTIAKSDPIEFLKSFDKPLIIDEAQYVPEIFSAVQVISDESESCGRFILSGSQNFLLLKNITQSFAGRVGILKLLPLSFSEIHEYKKILIAKTSWLKARILESITHVFLKNNFIWIIFQPI